MTGERSRSIDHLGSSRSVDGYGDASYTVGRSSSMFIVSAVIQKSDYGTDHLTVKITKTDGTALKASSTSAEFGVATVSWYDY